jgi:hypothetical protein
MALLYALQIGGDMELYREWSFKAVSNSSKSRSACVCLHVVVSTRTNTQRPVSLKIQGSKLPKVNSLVGHMVLVEPFRSQSKHECIPI